MKLLGDKQSARARAAATGVPTAPGAELAADLAAAEQSILAFFKAYGGPALLKATAGGGGKGMRRLNSPAGCRETLERASAEAQKLFGNGTLYVEKCIETARHIEVQFIADHHGTIGILFDRDCSTQRNNQKIIEEGPAIAIPEAVRQRAYDATRTLVTGSGYCGAGTAEFLLSDTGDLYFLEVNARLQVEHPVTEMITGVDLVELQIRAARNESIAHHLPTIAFPTVHSIELRICAESADGQFHPSSGRLLRCQFPEAADIRVDSGFQEGDFFSPYYDSLLAKIIVTGPSRAAALDRARTALRETNIVGVETNCSLLLAILTDVQPTSIVHTSYLASFLESYSYEASLAAAACRILLFDMYTTRMEGMPPRWNATGQQSIQRTYRYKDVELVVRAHISETGSITVQCLSETLVVHCRSIKCSADFLTIASTTDRESISVYQQSGRYWLQSQAGQFVLDSSYRQQSALPVQNGAEQIVASLPGSLIKVLVTPGEHVPAGTVLAVLESMKMEHEIRCAADRTIATVHCSVGQQVASGEILFELTA
jgi:acetyl/propionyl-CoA carboxylase alpha subunit